jgi:uracil DNA glycosylase
MKKIISENEIFSSLKSIVNENKILKKHFYFQNKYNEFYVFETEDIEKIKNVIVGQGSTIMKYKDVLIFHCLGDGVYFYNIKDKNVYEHLAADYDMITTELIKEIITDLQNGKSIEHYIDDDLDDDFIGSD